MRPRFKIQHFSKRKWLAGAYVLNNREKNNARINSKSLTVLGAVFVVLFILSLLLSVVLFGAVAFNKVNQRYVQKENTIYERTSSLGILLPSIKTDSINEMREELEDYEAGHIEIQEVKKRNVVFLPIYLFIPIIFIISFTHEFGHYIMCRRAGVRVKEYGLGFAWFFYIPIPILMAYVNPMAKDFKNTSKFNYFSIVGGGVGMNIILLPMVILFLYLTKGFIFWDYMLLVNIGIILTNALPLLPLDGGLLIKKISKKFSYATTTLSLLLLGVLIL